MYVVKKKKAKGDVINSITSLLWTKSRIKMRTNSKILESRRDNKEKLAKKNYKYDKQKDYIMEEKPNWMILTAGGHQQGKG